MSKKHFFPIVFVFAFCLIPSLTLAEVSFSLKVRGGLNYLQAGDVNPGSQGIFDAWRDDYYNAGNGWTQTGGYKALHYGFDLGVDLILQFNRHLGVSIGSGYLRSSRTSQATFSQSGTVNKITSNPQLWALPIRLAMFYTTPLGRRFNFTAGVGGEFYPTAQFHEFERVETDGMSPFWSEHTYSDHRIGLGAVGNLGIEYNMSPKLAIFIEAQGRYARFNGGFKGEDVYADSTGYTYTGSGELHLMHSLIGSRIYSYKKYLANFSGTGGIPEIMDLGEAKIDFSGVSLQAGIRIHF